MDDRFFRTSPNDPVRPEILGQAQLNWLIHELKQSEASFKMIAMGGQVLNSGAVFENYAVFAEERTELLTRLAEEEITGIVFLTGDRHHTEPSRYEAENGVVFYYLTTSPFTSKFYDGENNKYRVDGVLVVEHNYAQLDFYGTTKKQNAQDFYF